MATGSDQSASDRLVDALVENLLEPLMPDLVEQIRKLLKRPKATDLKILVALLDLAREIARQRTTASKFEPVPAREGLDLLQRVADEISDSARRAAGAAGEDDIPAAPGGGAGSS